MFNTDIPTETEEEGLERIKREHEAKEQEGHDQHDSLNDR